MTKFPCIGCNTKKSMVPGDATWICLECGSVLSNYVEKFNLDSNERVNKFIGDFLDKGKVKTTVTDYCEEFRLISEDFKYTEFLVSMFVYSFCHYEILDEKLVEIKSDHDRLKMERDLGLMNFREEHERSILEMEKGRLEKKFDKYLN